MLNINKPLLQFVYRSLMIGMPQYAYNPLSENNLLAQMSVLPKSTYINYKLNSNQINYLNNYISQYNDNDFKLVPIKFFDNDIPEYYLSINVYNCSSPLFMNDLSISRCEINTYVKNKFDEEGTMILDYVSNGISLDPVNLFKRSNNLNFQIDNDIINIYTNDDINNKDKKFDINFKFNSMKQYNNRKSKKLNNQLIEFTDNIFYKNGIKDKIYYDSSLLQSDIILIDKTMENIFCYLDLYFTQATSVFYFKDKINFVGSIWDNIYQ